ncbi:MAG: lipopolysaccharide biosynthesis protein [Candidatus Nanopelagicales bacterium]
MSSADDTLNSSDSAPTVALGGWHDLIRSGLTKFVALGLSAILGIVITRLIIVHYGVAVFAQYGLLVGVATLLPVNALGVGAPIVNTVAGSVDPANDSHLRRVLITSLRVLVAGMLVLLVGVVVMSVLSLWGPVLGEGLLPGTGAIAAALCVVIWAINMPFGIGERVLIGLGKNHVTIMIGALQSPLVLLFLVIAIGMSASVGSFIPVVSYAATLIISVIGTVAASRMIKPTLGQAIKQSAFRRRFPGEVIRNQAGPMTVIMIALPLSMQTDRLILSHVAGSNVLAQYNLAAQMFTPIFALVSAAGFTLWPRFAAARARDEAESPLRLTVAFGLIAAALSLAVALVSGFLARIASAGEVSLGLLLVASFAVWMTLQGVQYPMGMYLTDTAGLRFQAVMVTLMVPVNIAISWWLATVLGAAGPVLGSIIGLFFFQICANLIYVRQRMVRAVTAGDA